MCTIILEYKPPGVLLKSIETHFIGGIKLLNPLYYRIGTFIAHIAHFYGMLSRMLNYKYTT